MNVNERTEAELDELVSTVLTTSRVVVGLAARALEQAEIEVTLPQYRLLVLLDRHGPQTLGSLAALLAVSASNATRMCDRLVHRGLVRRETSPQDRREVWLSLCDAGKRVVDETTSFRRRELHALLAGVSDADYGVMRRVLAHINAEAGEEIEQDWPAAGA
jgi:DNA-binding MarR family transcriptional regulator